MSYIDTDVDGYTKTRVRRIKISIVSIFHLFNIFNIELYMYVYMFKYYVILYTHG